MEIDNNLDLEVQDDSIETPEDDKTSEKNESDKQGDKKTDLDDILGENEKDEDKKPNSEVIQKIKYREKYQQVKTELEGIKRELEQFKSSKSNGEEDESEKKAKEYIRNQAKEVLMELQNMEKTEEEKIISEFEDKVEAVIDENPEISEEQILDICEEFEVEPETAVKIIKKQNGVRAKPKMPSSKRFVSNRNDSESKKEDSGKSIWQIAQEVKSELKKKFT